MRKFPSASYDAWKTTEPADEGESPAPCPHGQDEGCPICSGEVDGDDDECTCSRSRHERQELIGFPCDCCGRIVL